MKKILVILVLNLLALSLFAQEWIGIGSPKPTSPKVALLSETSDEITVHFQLGGYYINKVETPRGEAAFITVPKMASLLEEGAPDLPLFAIPVAIGNTAEMSVEVASAQYKEVQGVEIAPSKGNFSREIDPETVPYRYGEAYTKNAFYPSMQASLDYPYILRDVRGQNILVYPFAYNPVTKVLRVYTEMTLIMHKISDNGENLKVARRGAVKLAPETEAMYANRFVNYREKASKYNFFPDEGETMVICSEQYMAAMQPYVDWKNQSGRPTTMYSLAEAGGNNYESIKSFILGHYDNPSENL